MRCIARRVCHGASTRWPERTSGTGHCSRSGETVVYGSATREARLRSLLRMCKRIFCSDLSGRSGARTRIRAGELKRASARILPCPAARSPRTPPTLRAVHDHHFATLSSRYSAGLLRFGQMMRMGRNGCVRILCHKTVDLMARIICAKHPPLRQAPRTGYGLGVSVTMNVRRSAAGTGGQLRLGRASPVQRRSGGTQVSDHGPMRPNDSALMPLGDAMISRQHRMSTMCHARAMHEHRPGLIVGTAGCDVQTRPRHARAPEARQPGISPVLTAARPRLRAQSLKTRCAFV